MLELWNLPWNLSTMQKEYLVFINNLKTQNSIVSLISNIYKKLLFSNHFPKKMFFETIITWQYAAVHGTSLALLSWKEIQFQLFRAYLLIGNVVGFLSWVYKIHKVHWSLNISFACAFLFKISNPRYGSWTVFHLSLFTFCFLGGDWCSRFWSSRSSWR